MKSAGRQIAVLLIMVARDSSCDYDTGETESGKRRKSTDGICAAADKGKYSGNAGRAEFSTGAAFHIKW